MKTLRLLVLLIALPTIWLNAQSPGAGGLDPAAIKKPLSDSWPVYSGDYSGRRFSSLKQVDRTTVKNLALAWVARLTAGTGAGPAPAAGGPGAGGGPPAPAGPPMIVGGVGTGEFAAGGAPNVKGSILVVDDVLYVTAPDNVWAVDAHDGRVIWQYYWKTRGGTHIGNRGAALRFNTLYFETPDNYLVAIDSKTGKEKWHVEIADFEQQYLSTTAPVVVDNHVIVGTGNDLDAPGFLQSYDAETGKLQWKLYMTPMNPGDPGLDTWPSLDAARHGGGHPWLPGSYDPETRLYIVGTGNPTPAYTGVARPGDNLFTCSLVAVNVDTGQDGVALPDVSSRYPRLGLGPDAHPDRRRHQRETSQARFDGGSQRIFLHARSRHRRTHRDEQVRHRTRTGQKKCDRPASSLPTPARKQRFLDRWSRQSKAV